MFINYISINQRGYTDRKQRLEEWETKLPGKDTSIFEGKEVYLKVEQITCLITDTAEADYDYYSTSTVLVYTNLT